MHSTPGALLFGMGSDASVVRGQASAVWMSVLTDYGVIGFVWVFVLFFVPIVCLLRQHQLTLAGLLFGVLFAMSFYQRPMIWLPAQVLLYFAGLCYCDSTHRRSSLARPNQ
jgi:hypothetical protein